MRTGQFDFKLPDDLIALSPVTPRDAARLLVVRPQQSPALQDLGIRDLAGLLRPGDALVFNDTKVIPASLEGMRMRAGGAARFSANLLERRDAQTWTALAKPAKKLKVGDRVRFGDANPACLTGCAEATITAKGESGQITLFFDLAGPDLDAAISHLGAMPLPPYIATRRRATETDRTDYQTVYADRDGAVAAPTAGLHFTDELLADLRAAGVGLHFVTLHVGAGTFLPVKTDDTSGHKMHSEWGEVSAATADALNGVRAAGGRIVAVGTTTLRLLESAAGEDGHIGAYSDSTDIFITPGYRFRAVDILMTNFHLPRSTLFMLVSAFSGLETMRAAYAHAIEQLYRFYSYGDACLLFPAATDT